MVFPDIEAAYYEHDEVQSIMLYVLRHYHFLADVDRGFRKTLRQLAFMPRSDMLTTVDRFYDPDHELLQKLFLFEENFPVGPYADPSVVAVLREVCFISYQSLGREGEELDFAQKALLVKIDFVIIGYLEEGLYLCPAFNCVPLDGTITGCQSCKCGKICFLSP